MCLWKYVLKFQVVRKTNCFEEYARETIVYTIVGCLNDHLIQQ